MMGKLPLTFACGFYDRVQALYTGDVVPDGIDLNFIPIDDPREIFDRMSGRLEFDASEMSISELVTRHVAGNCPFVALPVFVSRVFRHQFVFVNKRSGIESPKDLAGRRVGVPLYTQTAAVFIRGMLEHEYGVDLSGVQWVQGASEHAGTHGTPTVMPLLRPTAITQNHSGRSLSQMLEDGAANGGIDALITATIPGSFGRNPDVVRMFPDYRKVEADYFKRTRIFPIMHLIVIRKDVAERHPFVATSMYKALCEARDFAVEKMRDVGALRYMLPWLVDDFEEIDRVFGEDFWRYGVDENRATLEALVTYLHEQGMIARTVPIEELFVKTFGQGM
jgi:4,5-dihydroxyphthalate decarboxylase